MTETPPHGIFKGAHEDHEGFIHFILLNFVLFAIFVVKCLFLLWLRLCRARFSVVKSPSSIFSERRFEVRNQAALLQNSDGVI